MPQLLLLTEICFLVPPSLKIRSILSLFVPSNTRLLSTGSRQANKFFLNEFKQPLNQNKESDLN